MSDSTRVEHIRPDIGDLAQKAAKSMLDREEQQARQQAVSGPPETRRESYGIIAQKVASGEWRGRIIGTLPGADGETTVYWTPRKGVEMHEGLVAMAHRKYLEILTRGCVCDAATARRRAAEAEFYVATVL